MARRVDARDVLDANATTRRAFTGRVIAFYRRTGPNSWDDYERIDRDGGAIEVMAETAVQIEGEGAVFRMRRKGEVIVVRWVPDEDLSPDVDARARFLECCIRSEDPTPEGSFGVWLHGQLKQKRELDD